MAAAAVATGLVGPPAASAAPTGEGTIGPGALMATPVGDGSANTCTAAFVFSGGESTYLGFAAHCAGLGGSMGLSGCEEPVLPIGSRVVVEGDDGRRHDARLAYSSWVTMQERGETDEDLCMLNDFALVELDPAAAAEIDPSVPGLGGPTGLDTDGTRRGEPVFSYQPVNGGTTLKQGSSLGDSAGGLTHRVVTDPPGRPGDSGSGYLDGDGTAFGVLSTQFTGPRPSNGVTDLAMAVEYATSFGDLGPIELVTGTVGFTPPD